MDPVTIVVLLIGFGVWVLSNVLKNAAANQPAGKQGPRPRPARPAGSEIDRFLEEINRRRQQQQQPLRQAPAAEAPPQASAAPPRRPQPVRPIEARPLHGRPKSKPKPVRVEQPLPRVKAVIVGETLAKAEPAVRPQAIVVATPVAPPPTARVVDIAPMLGVSVPQEPAAAEKVAQAAGPVEATVASRGRPSLAQEIRRILHEPASLRAAVVATEILGAPRCRRRFRR